MALQAEDDAVGEKPVGIPGMKDTNLLKPADVLQEVSRKQNQPISSSDCCKNTACKDKEICRSYKDVAYRAARRNSLITGCQLPPLQAIMLYVVHIFKLQVDNGILTLVCMEVVNVCYTCPKYV